MHLIRYSDPAGEQENPEQGDETERGVPGTLHTARIGNKRFSHSTILL